MCYGVGEEGPQLLEGTRLQFRRGAPLEFPEAEGLRPGPMPAQAIVKREDEAGNQPVVH